MNREEFEKWAREYYPVFHDAITAQTAWDAWKACSALYAKLTAEPTPEALTLPGDFFSKGK